MTPSISSEANTRPGTRMPGLCFSGSSHRRSSIFSRASFHLVTIICHLVSCGPPLSARPICWPPCPQASNIEQHLRPVAAVLLDHLQHVSRYRLHPEVQPVALPVYPLAPGPRPPPPPQGRPAVRVSHEGEHAGGGVGEDLFQAGPMRHDAHVGGVLQDLEGRLRHGGTFPPPL